MKRKQEDLIDLCSSIDEDGEEEERLQAEEETLARKKQKISIAAEEEEEGPKKKQKIFKVGIRGGMCAGKTTTCDALTEGFIGPVKSFKFASAIYEAAYAAGMSRDPKKKDRDLLIRIGGKFSM